jgi:DNA-directed RNA polymerase
MRTVNMAKNCGITDISCIHDSFGVCPADAGSISTIIRECAVDMFDNPLLHGVQSEMSKYLPKGISLPDPPKQGSLDISQLRNADYFFA